MKFVPVIHCPVCQTPYTSAQLGFPFRVGPRYTVICGFNDCKGRKCGCGSAFDFEVVDVDDFETIESEEKAQGILGFFGKKAKVQTITKSGSHLEVRYKVRGA